MSRKSSTVATFAVTIQVPAGSNLSIVQSHIRQAIAEFAHMTAGRPDVTGIESMMLGNDWFTTVVLIKKVTTYGAAK